MFDLESYLGELETLVNIDSGTYAVGGVNRVGDFFAARFESLGWIVERVRISDQVGYLLDIRSREAERYDALLIGHMDTVFPQGEAKRRPFAIRGGRAYGPGVADMQCGVLAIWHALRELPESAKTLSIRVVMNPDEEITSLYSTDYIAKASARAEHVLVMEPAMADGSFCIERKGKIKYEFEFTGIPTHAGYVFDRRNASAVYEMAKWIEALMALGDRDKGTSVNIGRVEGGDAENIVAEHAHMSMEFRMWEAAEAERIKAAVDFMLRHPFVEGARVEATFFREQKVMSPSARTLAFVERMRKLYEKRGVPFSIKRCGGISDANTAAAYAPVVVDRIGPWGDHNHSELEYMLPESAQYAVLLLQDMLADIARARDAS
ncbi:MAG TPA: M20 family metallopeptidase [Clostridia bacterium]|nr:M20 family metallopeptidase [Clostridia bacterium]HPK16296.1 M20 family metallopeptidase [Clostridia bacterium]